VRCRRHGGLHQLGYQYYFGRGVGKDLSRSFTLQRRACDGRNAAACGAAGSMYESGNGAPRDLGRANDLYRRACDGAR